MGHWDVAGRAHTGHDPRLPLSVGRPSMSEVALVTGASSGIGAGLRARPAHDHPRLVIRWYMRINKPAPPPIKLRVLERMYRPNR
jgi:hypothetical protein